MVSLNRVQSGLIRALDLSAVPNGTDLHGLLNWQCYDPLGSGAGLYVVTGGEIVSNTNLAYAMALWGDPTVKNPGHCVRADVMSPNWSTLVLGLCANGALDHSEETRCLLYDNFELRERSGTGDYGSGFPITTGSTTGGPLTNGVYYSLLLASVQNPGGGFHARGGVVYNNTLLAFSDSNLGLLTGINDGSDTYPGLLYWNNPGLHWRNYKVYKDYRILVRGLTGTQAFRLFDAGGSPLLDSPTQSGNVAHVNAHLLTWPITGHIEVFTDNTFTTPVASLRFPATSGNDTNINGGDIYDVSSISDMAVQINWDDAPNPPDEWTFPVNKNVTLDVVDIDVIQYAANPNIQQDTATFTFRDPLGKYVPARTNGAHYPNVKEGKWIRWLVVRNGVTKCRFVGKIKEVEPVVFPPTPSGREEQGCVMRAESPIRELALTQLTLVTLPSGVLVEPDGVSGVIPYLLSLVPDIIPPANWDLTPTPATVESGFFDSAKSLLVALQQCAILSDSLYFIEPQDRESFGEVYWTFRWIPGDAQHDQVSDHDWVDTDNDIHDFKPLRFTTDQL